MTKSILKPMILLLGQPNAGKSTLFNRLIGRKQAIVSDTAQTTRDLLRANCVIDSGEYELVDSAGLTKTRDELSNHAQAGTRELIQTAQLVLLVVDGTILPSPTEHQLASQLHKADKTVVLVINKIDNKLSRDNLAQWQKLGFSNMITISALHNLGITELKSAILTNTKAKPVDIATKPLIKVAILGKPNAGKSSMFNVLAGNQIALVSDTPNTTRDVNYYQIQAQHHQIEFADTAGLSRAGKRKADIEFYASRRAEQALNSADIGLVLIDSREYLVAMQKRIAGLIKDSYKGLIIVVTKSDLIADEAERTMIERQISAHFQFAWWAPLVFTTTLKPKTFQPIIQQIETIFANYQREISTSELNAVLQNSVASQPPAGVKNARIHLNYITQIGIKPPTFAIFGSKTDMIHFSYRRYLENKLRQTFDFAGTPIKIEFKSKYKDGNEANHRTRQSRRKVSKDTP